MSIDVYRVINYTMWQYIFKGIPEVSKSGYEFKMMHSFEKRKEESTRLIAKYPNSRPVILEKSKASMLPNVEKKKYLLASNVTIGQFVHIIRKQMMLDHTQTIFLFIDNEIIPMACTSIGDNYAKYADNDGYLYITYTSENTFG